MTVPGSNLLAQALAMIGPQSITYYQDAGRTTSAAGFDVTAYEEPITVSRASVQAVPLRNYASLGLDFKRKYVNVFACADIIGLDRDRSGDQVGYAGKRYDIEASTPWYGQDGWVEMLCIEVGPDA